MDEKEIVITGAKQFNLKNISLRIPHRSITVVTGLSGSGKSSLVIDTLYAEGRRRYLELVSDDLYVQFGNLTRPEVDSIEGLPPVFLVGGEPYSVHPRSTVGTVTGLQDYLRVLFSKVGEIHCYRCKDILRKYSSHEIVDQLISLSDSKPIYIMVPVEEGASINALRKEGFVRVKIKNKILDLDQIQDQKLREASIIIDRLVADREQRSRLTESVELAMKYGKGKVEIRSGPWPEGKAFCREYYCLKCHVKYGEMSPASFSFNSPYGACESCHGLGVALNSQNDCEKCHGMRFKDETLSVRIGSKNIAEIGEMGVVDLIEFLSKLKFEDTLKIEVANHVIPKMMRRLELMKEIGIPYLTPNRFLKSLSSGEIQRVKMVSQMALGLVGVLYVMDEPTTGLHPLEINNMIAILQRIKKQGNTLVIVEHDRQMMAMADYLIELGPGAGFKGGKVMAAGDYPTIMSQSGSLTARVMREEVFLKGNEKRIKPTSFIELKGIRKNNLKNIDVKIPLGLFCCITGVSGAGKSTLVKHVLCKLLAECSEKDKKGKAKEYCREAIGLEKVNQMIIVDDQWVLKNKRSIVATYTEIYNSVRMLFSKVPESRLRGYQDTRFSLNTEGGRCEACNGCGFRKIEMTFMPDFEVLCEICQGWRFNQETLEIKYKGKNIAEVLQMTVEEAASFFENIPKIRRRLECLMKIGLNYLRLGQTCSSLSSGEAQRMKLATQLDKRTVGHTLYVFDEPTRGLHLLDIQKLLDILIELRELGHTVLVIEHHPELIWHSDYIIELGPGAGQEGGCLISQGAPEVIEKDKKSRMGIYLNKIKKR